MRVNSVITNVFAGQRRIDRHQREHDQQRGIDHGARREPAPAAVFEKTVHLLAAGNRPSGRTMRTAAISM